MLDAQIVGYLLSYRVNGSGNVGKHHSPEGGWMLRFDTEAQAQAHIKKVGLDTPMYQCVVNPIVEMTTIEEPKGLPMWRRR